MDRFTEPVTKPYCCNKDWTFLDKCKFALFQIMQFCGFIRRLLWYTDFLEQAYWRIPGTCFWTHASSTWCFLWKNT